MKVSWKQSSASLRADRRDEEAEHVGAVLVEQRPGTAAGPVAIVHKRLTRGIRETVRPMGDELNVRAGRPRPRRGPRAGRRHRRGRRARRRPRAGRRSSRSSPGVLFGLDAAARGASPRPGAERFEALLRRGRSGATEVPATVARVAGPRPRAAGGRARRAQPARPPLGRRDPDRALRRRPSRARAPRSSTPARRPRGCARSRRRRWRRAAASTTGWASTTRS